MTLQQLHYVTSVARTGSFSRAAEECFVTQPTLSAQIHKLEDELGVQLLDRSRKPVVPTAAGRTVLGHARHALHLIDEIPALIESRSREISGRLRLGVIPTVSQYLLPLFLKPFLDAYPAVHVEVHEQLSDRVMDDLLDHRIDVGILALPTGRSGLQEHPLFYEEFVGYFPREYDLDPGGGVPEVLSVSELRWEEMLLLAEGHCFREQTINICHRQEHRRVSRLEFETGSLESLKRLVEQGLGYTLLPELATYNLGTEERLRVRRLAEPRPTREIGLLTEPGFIQRDLLAALERAIVESLPEKVRENVGRNRVPWRTT